jgi:hypothetical protein
MPPRLNDHGGRILWPSTVWRNQSMYAWIEAVLMLKTCAAHADWLSEHPKAVSFSEAWADRNLGIGRVGHLHRLQRNRQ